MEQKAVGLYLRIWRAVALYAVFAAVMALSCLLFIFFGYSLSDKPLGDALDRELFLFPFVVQSVILFFFLGSLLRVFAERDGRMKHSIYPGAERIGTFWQSARLVLSSRLFWTELGVLCALPLLLPMECGLFPLYFLLFGKATFSRALQKLLLLCILWPLLFLLSLWQHVNALYTWQETEISGRPDDTGKLIAPLLGTAALYGAAMLFIPPIVSVLLGALAALASISFSLVGAVVGGALLLLYLWRYPRAFLIRRKFLKKLRARCKACGFELSDIKRPYASILRMRDGLSFTVTANGKRYACKMLAGLARHNAMSLSPDGVAHVIHVIGLRIGARHAAGMRATFFFARDGKSDQMLHARWFQHLELFRFTTKTDFSFESDTQKILIVNPVPFALFAGTEQRACPIDNGDTVGDYKIFAGTAFLNALERDCVDK